MVTMNHKDNKVTWDDYASQNGIHTSGSEGENNSLWFVLDQLKASGVTITKTKKEFDFWPLGETAFERSDGSCLGSMGPGHNTLRELYTIYERSLNRTIFRPDNSDKKLSLVTIDSEPLKASLHGSQKPRYKVAVTVFDPKINARVDFVLHEVSGGTEVEIESLFKKIEELNVVVVRADRYGPNEYGRIDFFQQNGSVVSLPERASCVQDLKNILDTFNSEADDGIIRKFA